MRARLALLGALAGALPSACSSPSEPPVQTESNYAALASFSLEQAHNPGLAGDIVGTITGDTVRLLSPVEVDVTSLVPTFEAGDARSSVFAAGALQHSGSSAHDFTTDVRYRVVTLEGDMREYVVSVTVFTGLPVIHVTTDGNVEVTSRYSYIPATIRVYGGKDHPEWSFTSSTQIRGRGHSTWETPPKKPYRLKLTTTHSMFGFPADRDWALLANYWDQAFVRNAVAFEMSKALGMSFTPRCAPFELVMNGTHRGSYQLCDHVEAAANRVPMAAGGWFLELNGINRVEPGESFFHTPEIDWYTTVGHGDTIPAVWVYKEPDPPTALQRAAVEGEVLDFERVLYGATFTDPDSGYATRIDVRSVVDWYLVMELTKNNDAAFSFGQLMYQSAPGRIAFGPVWDFDLAFGNYPYDAAPEGWKIRPSGWMPRFFADTAFAALVRERWQVLRAKRAELDAFIVAYTDRLHLSQQRSHAIWSPYLPAPTLRTAPMFGSSALMTTKSASVFTDADFAAEVQRVRTWLSTRFDWLDPRIMAP